MERIDSHILDIDRVICKNIDRFDDSERGILSQNILSQLRNFVEHIALKVYSNGQDIENTYSNIEIANNYVKTKANLKFLSKFQKLLQITVSHYTLDEENSERLMLKYYEYLIRIKSFLKETFKLEVLENINRFPLQTDSNLGNYYAKIAEKINEPAINRSKNPDNDRFYIQKIKPFFVNYECYYEVTFCRAVDNRSKFDRIIAFTKLDILHNYAVRLSISNENINILGKRMPILIIDNWEVSIRPCELNNFVKIFQRTHKVNGTREYYDLMKYIKETGASLNEIIDFSDDYFDDFKNKITRNSRIPYFFNILVFCRNITKKKQAGMNIIKYLLYRLNNKTIKLQFASEPCSKLSNLQLEYGCIPFDDMPFNTSPIGHNPKLVDLYECIDSNGREHELFARFIKNNTELKGQLYTPKKDIRVFENIQVLIDRYNKRLYSKHTDRRIEIYKEHFFIKGYESKTHLIIKRLKDLSLMGLRNYTNSVNAWLQSSAYSIDCDEKENYLKLMFENSRVALIFGAAGTGKSTMINHVSNFFADESKLFLCNTNPAIDNLKRKVRATNSTFKTITKFFSDNSNSEFDLLIIDECSTVSNSDMLKILDRTSFRLLVLVGDIFQIESILFGNWFGLTKYFVNPLSIFELNQPYRSSDPNLLTLWAKVRKVEEDILEHIAKNQYSITLDQTIFENSEKEEIILCLNYDGLYGINNINRFLQSNNNGKSIVWGVHTYKVNDPILFNETNRFSPVIYNNLKGRIRDFEVLDEQIQFDIEIDKVLNEFDSWDYDFDLMENAENGNSVIRFIVDKHESTDEDEDSSSNSIVPFQVAYAVSIHKSQGLEYDSVKVVITNEVDELITHNIFYTAITRAREKLKIYWSPETENKILGNFKNRFNGRDMSLLREKFSDLLN